MAINKIWDEDIGALAANVVMANGETVEDSITPVIVDGVEGETIGATLLCYLNQTDNKWYLAKADNKATCSGVLGMWVASGKFQVSGIYDGWSALPDGAKWYLSDTTAGYFYTYKPTAAGSFIKEVGEAVSDNQFQFNLKGPLMELGEMTSAENPVIHLTKTASASQNLGGWAGTTVYVSWDNQVKLSSGTFAHSTTTNNTRVTVNQTGRYSLYVMVGADQDGGARTVLMSQVRVNGSTVITRGRERNYSRGTTWSNLSVGIKTELDLIAGDYIEFASVVDGSDGLYVNPTFVDECELIMRKIPSLLPAVNSFPLTDDADFAGFKATAMACDNGTSFPSAPSYGQWFLRSDLDILYQYTTAWRPIVGFADIDCYVDKTNGSDAVGKGYSATTGATQTIQYCIDNCIPSTVYGTVSVNCSAEAYAEDVKIGGFNIIGDNYLRIVGAKTLVRSGTTTSVYQGGNYPTTKPYANTTFPSTNSDLGYIFEFNDDTGTSSLRGIQRTIRYNSTSQCNLVGKLPASGGSEGFKIYKQGTDIQNIECTNQPKCRIEWIEFTGTDNRLTYHRYSQVDYIYCKSTRTSGRWNTYHFDTRVRLGMCYFQRVRHNHYRGDFEIDGCYIIGDGATWTVALFIGVSMTCTGHTILDGGSTYNALYCAASTWVGSTTSPGWILETGCGVGFENCALGVSVLQHGRARCSTTYPRYTNCTTNYTIDSATYGVLTG